MPSNQLILCHPLLLLPSIFPSTRFFANESALCFRWPKYWSFNFNETEPSVLPMNTQDCSPLGWTGWISCSLLQHHSSKASILQHSDFFIVSHPYMTTGKTIALTRWTFVGKVISLIFNMLSAAATAAKSLRSCPTLCDPIDSSPLGSSVSGILQARICYLGWS